jgi:hypothetical protein
VGDHSLHEHHVRLVERGVFVEVDVVFVVVVMIVIIVVVPVVFVVVVVIVRFQPLEPPTSNW